MNVHIMDIFFFSRYQVTATSFSTPAVVLGLLLGKINQLHLESFIGCQVIASHVSIATSTSILLLNKLSICCICKLSLGIK